MSVSTLALPQVSNLVLNRANAPRRAGKSGCRLARSRRKLAGRSAIVALVLLAAITGSLAGLTLVYSSNLPQIQDLEHYKPSTITDLYDRKGRIVGSFALERREVVVYEGFAPVLRQAVISIEDKNFESHWGINAFVSPGPHGTTFAATAARRAPPRSPCSWRAFDRTAMRKRGAGGVPRRPNGAATFAERADLHALRQSDLPGQRKLRL